eukprot:782726-Pelagomonas_calceolata.AAC.2
MVVWTGVLFWKHAERREAWWARQEYCPGMIVCPMRHCCCKSKASRTCSVLGNEYRLKVEGKLGVKTGQAIRTPKSSLLKDSSLLVPVQMVKKKLEHVQVSSANPATQGECACTMGKLGAAPGSPRQS